MIANISTPSNQVQDTQLIQNQAVAEPSEGKRFLSVLEKVAGNASSQSTDNTVVNEAEKETDAEVKTETMEANTEATTTDKANTDNKGATGQAEDVSYAEDSDDSTDLLTTETVNMMVDLNFALAPLYCSVMSVNDTAAMPDSRSIKAVDTQEIITSPETVANKKSFASNVSIPELPIEGKQVEKAEVKESASTALINEQTDKITAKEEKTLSVKLQSLSDLSKVKQNEEVPNELSLKQAVPMLQNSGNEMIPEGNTTGEKTYIETLGEKTQVLNNETKIGAQSVLSQSGTAAVIEKISTDSLKASEYAKSVMNTLKKAAKEKSVESSATSEKIASEATTDNTADSPIAVEASIDTNSTDSTSSSDAPVQEKSATEKDATSGTTQEAFGLAKAEVMTDKTMVIDQKTQSTNEPEAYKQIYDKISYAIKENSSTDFKMKLYPEGLGEISVTLNCQDNKISLEIVTDNPLTQKLLQGQAEELKAALLTKNYEVPSFNISAKSETAATFTSTGDAPFSFFERNASSEQYSQNGGYSAYDFSGNFLGSEESFSQINQQNIYFGSLNSWA